MKKIYFLIILTMLFLLIGCRAQKNQEIPNDSFAQEEALFHNEDDAEETITYYNDYYDYEESENIRNLKINYGAENVSLPPMIDLFKYDEELEHYISFNYWFSSRNNFRLWGWSRDGKVAYSFADNWDGPGWISTEVYILNINDNKVLWKNSVVDNGEGREMIHSEGKGYDEEGPIIDYEAFFSEFRNICANNRIEFVQTEYKKLPIIHNNRTFNIIKEINKRKNPEYDYETIENYKIIIEAQGRRKVINEDSFSGSGSNRNIIFNIFSLGYFISPFENRALIIIGRHIYHYEGTNNDFILIGFHLETGF